MLVLDFCTDSIVIWRFIGKIVMILKIVIPVLIILLGSLDLGKAVISGKEDDIKKAQGSLIKRIIYGVAIFFLVTIIQVIFGLVSDASAGSDETAPSTTNKCFQCIANNGEC